MTKYEKKIAKWNEKVISLPPFLKNVRLKKSIPEIEVITELDDMINKIREIKNTHPSQSLNQQIKNLEKQIFIRSLQYRQYYQEQIPPEQILQWLDNHPEIEKSRLSETATELRAQAFYKKLTSFQNIAATITWLEKTFEALKIEEINAFLDWIQHHAPVSKRIKNRTKSIVQKSKQIFFQAIKKEVEHEKNALLENYPFLEEPSLYLGEFQIVGMGNFATIIEFSSQNTVIKIPNEPTEFLSPEGYNELIQEANNHLEFDLAIDRLKRTTSNPIPDWLAVPQIRKVPKQMPDTVEDMLYIMEKVHGLTLKRFAFLTVERLRKKLYPFSETEIRQFSEFEFEILLKKRKITVDEFKTRTDFVPDLFYEAFPPHTLLGSQFKNIKKVLASLKKRAKVLHTDLHSENIMIDEETETLYLIDFGIAITPSS